MNLKNGIFLQQKWKIKMRCFLCVSGNNDYDDDDDIDTNAVSDLGRNGPRTRTRKKKTMM